RQVPAARRRPRGNGEAEEKEEERGGSSAPAERDLRRGGVLRFLASPAPRGRAGGRRRARGPGARARRGDRERAHFARRARSLTREGGRSRGGQEEEAGVRPGRLRDDALGGRLITSESRPARGR